MVVWVNAAPRMQAGARRSKKEKTALKKAVSGILLPLYYGGLNGCSTLCFFRDFMPGGRENRKYGLKIAFLGS